MCVPLSQMDTDRQEALFKAMACPDFYPHAVRHVTQEETHISKVFLTGGDVYKIKKAVDLGFLDFSSLARRRRYCELEVTLNRRLTHQVYLGVIPITYADNRFHLSGSGRVVEFAVRMRQLPEARSLASLLEQDRITAQQIETLAVTMTDFYARQRQISPEKAAASWKNVRAACEENFKKTKWAEGGPLDAELYQAVRAATFSFLTRRQAMVIFVPATFTIPAPIGFRSSTVSNSTRVCAISTLPRIWPFWPWISTSGALPGWGRPCWTGTFDKHAIGRPMR